jgi:hypothetical protein
MGAMGWEGASDMAAACVAAIGRLEGSVDGDRSGEVRAGGDVDAGRAAEFDVGPAKFGSCDRGWPLLKKLKIAVAAAPLATRTTTTRFGEKDGA